MQFAAHNLARSTTLMLKTQLEVDHIKVFSQKVKNSED